MVTIADKNLERKARIFALFGDPTRLRILQILAAKNAVSVSDIADGIDMSVACASYHLNLLHDNDVVTSVREGNSVRYSLSQDPLMKSLKKLIS